MWSFARWMLVAAVFVSCSKKDKAPKPPSQAEIMKACDPASKPTGQPGKRRMALLVGIEHYRSSELSDLAAANRDVDAMYSLLTTPDSGYGFPKENVCVLRDDQATVAAVKKGLEAMIGDASQGDSVVFYYSGHGAQVPDNNHDENDGKDEAFVLYDSLAGDAGVLRDDDMNDILSRLSAKTSDVTLLLDSCTSAGATRGTMKGKGVEVAGGADLPEPEQGEGGFWTPAALADIVVLAAARDGASAFEPVEAGKLSYFTAALVEVLGAVNDKPLTWAQVARQIPQRIEAMSDREQFPLAQGNLERTVFSATERSRPLGWAVEKVGDTIALDGAVPLPGWGVGAQVAVYDGAATREVYADPNAAKALLEIVEFDNVKAEAAVIGTPKAAVAPGDIAVLVLPAPDSFRLKVAFDKDVPAATRDAVKAALAADAEAKVIVEITDAADFRILTAGAGLRLVDGDGVTRNNFPADPKKQASTITSTLVKHARQRALLALDGVGDSDVQDNATIEVQIQKTADQPECARQGWQQACPNQLQRIPLCNRWEVVVRNAHPTETLRVYGVVLASDGEMFAMPSTGQVLELPPNSEWRALDPGQPPFKAVPPVDVVEGVMVFAARRDVAVDKALLETTKEDAHPIQAIFESQTPGATRGTVREKKLSSLAAVSFLPYRVVANTLGAPTADATCKAAVVSREYTIPDFDVTPYLPKDPNAPLYKVLQTAEALHKQEIPYLQHDWSGATDADNLKKGIDCSRTMWWLFTRTGLPYINKPATKNYIATAEMFDAAAGSCRPEYTPEKSPLYENFDSCMDQPFQTGDVLVFQGTRPNSTDCVGHTVMVIDPEGYVGFGSHGWDGAKDKETGAKLNDTGVEYQVINAKTWGKWDRPEFALKACWRHHAFTAQPEKNVPPAEPFDTTQAGTFCDKCDR